MRSSQLSMGTSTIFLGLERRDSNLGPVALWCCWRLLAALWLAFPLVYNGTMTEGFVERLTGRRRRIQIDQGS